MNLTTKQINTLLLFAQDYSLKEIADKENVTIASIKNRLERLNKAYPDYFDNALGMRESCKRLRTGLLNAGCIDKDILSSLPKCID